MASKVRAYLLIAPLIVLATAVMGTLSLITSFFDATGKAQHRLARAWSRILLTVSGVRVRVEGIEKLDPMGSYVFVANHLSYMDTPVVLASIPLQFRFLAKESLFRIPLMGHHLQRAGHIPVPREDPRASIRALSDAGRIIREHGISILVFPEGGRSPEELRDFKEGAAYIALKAGVPAVPLGIQGTREVLAMHSSHVRPGEVSLRIGDPIPMAGRTLQDRRRLTAEFRDRVAGLMGVYTQNITI